MQAKWNNVFIPLREKTVVFKVDFTSNSENDKFDEMENENPPMELRFYSDQAKNHAGVFSNCHISFS